MLFLISVPDARWDFKEVDLVLEQTRTAHVADTTITGMYKARSMIHPAYTVFTSSEDSASDSGTNTDPVVVFGKKLEEVLQSNTGRSEYKIAVGASSSFDTNDEVLWLVAEKYLNLEVIPIWKERGPSFMAIPPLSTSLQSFSFSDIPVYEVPAPENPGSRSVLVTDTDMDDRGRLLIERVTKAADPALVARIIETLPLSDARKWVRNVTEVTKEIADMYANSCLLYTSPSPRDQRGSRMPSSA